MTKLHYAMTQWYNREIIGKCPFCDTTIRLLYASWFVDTVPTIPSTCFFCHKDLPDSLFKRNSQ